jgi:DNA replication initiation complex subunit (GINS family)
MPDPYSRLLEWRRAEAASRGLAKLPGDFYRSTEEYLAQTRRTFESELRDNPAGRRGEVARQTFQRAAQIARDIVEARMTKILSAAFQTSVGGGRDLSNALAEERGLFDSLVAGLRTHRTKVAPYLDSGSSTSAGAPTASAPAPAPSEPRARPDPSPGEAPTRRRGDGSAPPRSASATALAVVRILKDGRPIEIPGETLELRKEDVLSLPYDVGRLLVEGRVAEWVEPADRRAVT